MSISVGAQEFAALPVVPASDWVKAQKLIEEDIFKISFQVRSRNGVYVVPSSHLLRWIPALCKSPSDKQQYIKVSS